MMADELKVQMEQTKRLERELRRSRGQIADLLRAERERLGLSLRDVGPRVRLSHVSVRKIESGNQWETQTVDRLIRFYERAGAA